MRSFDTRYVAYYCMGADCGGRAQLVVRYGQPGGGWIEIGVVTRWLCPVCLSEQLGTREHEGR